MSAYYFPNSLTLLKESVETLKAYNTKGRAFRSEKGALKATPGQSYTLQETVAVVHPLMLKIKQQLQEKTCETLDCRDLYFAYTYFLEEQLKEKIGADVQWDLSVRDVARRFFCFEPFCDELSRSCQALQRTINEVKALTEVECNNAAELSHFVQPYFNVYTAASAFGRVESRLIKARVSKWGEITALGGDTLKKANATFTLFIKPTKTRGCQVKAGFLRLDYLGNIKQEGLGVIESSLAAYNRQRVSLPANKK